MDLFCFLLDATKNTIFCFNMIFFIVLFVCLLLFPFHLSFFCFVFPYRIPFALLAYIEVWFSEAPVPSGTTSSNIISKSMFNEAFYKTSLNPPAKIAHGLL